MTENLATTTTTDTPRPQPSLAGLHDPSAIPSAGHTPANTSAPSPAGAGAHSPAGPALSRRHLLVGTAALGGVIAFGSAAVGTGTAHAAGVGRPAIISTATWGARPPRRHLHTIGHRPGHLVIHHTAHENTAAVSTEAAHELARLLQRNHHRNGWADTGQHFTIARGGHVLEGRHGSVSALDAGTRFVEGAHAYGFNDESIGIEVDGTYMRELPTAAQWSALVHLGAYACRQYGIRAEDIIAHRDVPGAQTHCCGDALYSRLPSLRQDVAAALQDGTAGAGGDHPTLRRGDRGPAVRRLQSALHDTGHAPGAADGHFGAQTQRAVRGYQARIGTIVDGVAGPRTWGALVTRPAQGTPLAIGDSGPEVSHLQRGLTAALGEELVIDGDFGPATQATVRTYQSSRGLPVVGVAGPQTWGALKHGR